MSVVKHVKIIGKSAVYAGLAGIALAESPWALITDMASSSFKVLDAILWDGPYPESYFESTTDICKFFFHSQRPIFYSFHENRYNQTNSKQNCSEKAKLRKDIGHVFNNMPFILFSLYLFKISHALTLAVCTLMLASFSLSLIAFGSGIFLVADMCDTAPKSLTIRQQKIERLSSASLGLFTSKQEIPAKQPVGEVHACTVGC